jgi:hypothetical protein
LIAYLESTLGLVSSSDLEVKGWMSGLYLVVAPMLMVVGCIGLFIGFREFREAGRLTNAALANLAVGLCLPAGGGWFLRTLKNVRQDLNAQDREGEA